MKRWTIWTISCWSFIILNSVTAGIDSSNNLLENIYTITAMGTFMTWASARTLIPTRWWKGK